jgi:hypothetical protein
MIGRIGILVAVVAAFITTGASAAVVTYNDFASFSSAAGTLNLIDFDDGISGTRIGLTYAALGVDFPTGNRFNGGFLGLVSPPNGWINDTIRFFDADFTVGGITAVGVYNVLYAGTAALSAYDSLGQLIGQVVSDSDMSSLDFFGLIATTDIARIEINNLDGGWGLDDLYFGSQVAAVPLPAGLLLLLTGVGGLAVVGRRRKRSAPAAT